MADGVPQHSGHLASNVAVVGFGPAGGALALLLARMGRRVTLFERAPMLGPVGAGILLQPSGQAVLQKLGLLERVAERSERIEMLHAVQADGRTMVRLRYDGALPEAVAYGVHRGVLFETLHQAAADAGVDIRVGHEIVDVRESPDGATLVDHRGATFGPFDMAALCDGSRSRLRQTVDPTARAVTYDYGALWAVGPCTQVRGYLHQTVAGTRLLCGVLPIGDARATLFWGMRADQFEALRQSSFADFRDDVLRLCPQAEEIFTGFHSFEQATLARYGHAAPRTLFTAHTVLVGDAAHAMSPHLGQGANLALVDADALVRSLASSGTLTAAFERYVSATRDRVQFYSRLSRVLSPFFQGGGYLLGCGRDLALPLMTLVPPLRRQMELSLAGLKCGIFSFSPPADDTSHAR
ncbi:MAG: FAD-dependent monooxygenase [Pirellula sp.]|nr:FAD-dependent monooxygenase [Pirellula sp.]